MCDFDLTKNKNSNVNSFTLRTPAKWAEVKLIICIEPKQKLRAETKSVKNSTSTKILAFLVHAYQTNAHECMQETFEL